MKVLYYSQIHHTEVMDKVERNRYTEHAESYLGLNKTENEH